MCAFADDIRAAEHELRLKHGRTYSNDIYSAKYVKTGGPLNCGGPVNFTLNQSPTWYPQNHIRQRQRGVLGASAQGDPSVVQIAGSATAVDQAIAALDLRVTQEPLAGGHNFSSLLGSMKQKHHRTSRLPR